MSDTFGEMCKQEKVFWALVGKNIKNMRKRPNAYYDGRRKQITQTHLAKHLGLSRASIANIESGRQRVDLYTMQKINDFLNYILKPYDHADDALFLIGDKK